MGAECTKIAHRRSLAIFTADSGIAGNSAVGIHFVPFNRRENRRSLAIFDRKEIAHLGALKIAILQGSSKNRRRNRRDSRDFGALSFYSVLSFLGFFFFEKGRKTTKKQGFFYSYRTPKIPEKARKNAQKTKSSQARKTRNFKKNKETEV